MRPNTGRDFPNGAMKFQFAIPPNERGKINEAYFRMRVSLQVANRDHTAWIQPRKSFPVYSTYTTPAGNNNFTPAPRMQDGHDISFAEIGLPS
jgi:hypothetical protein